MQDAFLQRALLGARAILLECRIMQKTANKKKEHIYALAERCERTISRINHMASGRLNITTNSMLGLESEISTLYASFDAALRGQSNKAEECLKRVRSVFKSCQRKVLCEMDSARHFICRIDWPTSELILSELENSKSSASPQEIHHIHTQARRLLISFGRLNRHVNSRGLEQALYEAWKKKSAQKVSSHSSALAYHKAIKSLQQVQAKYQCFQMEAKATSAEQAIAGLDAVSAFFSAPQHKRNHLFAI